MQPTKPQASVGNPKPTKVIVAVHGIGDQFQFATIQSVANQFSAFSTTPQVFPLGKFYDQPIGTKPDIAYLLQVQLDKIGKEHFGFVEIYWADIPRIPEKEGYTLEESKKWGKTVVERLRTYSKSDPTTLRPRDVEMAKGLLEEILETLTVLDRLLLIADKAGLFKFNLQEILINYLGDVQLVTDFKKYRDKILHRFFEVMNYIQRFNPDAEIYIVAHSEGTVVAFLSLLQAAAVILDPNANTIPDDIAETTKHNPPLDCGWLRHVKGLMTIGSPIDKHLVFWPDLWTAFEKLPKDKTTHELLPNPLLPDNKILWRNYYDYGDPIGFELDTTREWLCENKLNRIFEFPKSSDHGFGRYPLPGKAHNDYWTDPEVFDHFIKTVVAAKPIDAATTTTMCSEEEVRKLPRGAVEPKPPGDRYLTKFLSNILPYFVIVGLIFLAVYFLYKAVNEYTEIEASISGILLSVTGIACLVTGLTVVAQVPRLTRVWKWRLASFVIFALSSAGYGFITPPEVRRRLGCFLANSIASGLVPASSIDLPTWSVIALASVIAVVVYLVGRVRPRAGLRTLLVLSVVGLIFTVGFGLRSGICAYAQGTAEKHEVWPLFIATAAFLYLWWLAALIFDLVVVWHYYIRRSVAMDRLRTMRTRARK